MRLLGLLKNYNIHTTLQPYLSQSPSMGPRHQLLVKLPDDAQVAVKTKSHRPCHLSVAAGPGALAETQILRSHLRSAE